MTIYERAEMRWGIFFAAEGFCLGALVWYSIGCGLPPDFSVTFAVLSSIFALGMIGLILCGVVLICRRIFFPWRYGPMND